MANLSEIYVTADRNDYGAELRCTEHAEWWADADGTALPDAIRSAVEHYREEHRIHVADCMCAERVIDTRCLQPIAYFGGSGPR
jgi:hypothetical protein